MLEVHLCCTLCKYSSLLGQSLLARASKQRPGLQVTLGFLQGGAEVGAGVGARVVGADVGDNDGGDVVGEDVGEDVVGEDVGPLVGGSVGQATARIVLSLKKAQLLPGLFWRPQSYDPPSSTQQSPGGVFWSHASGKTTSVLPAKQHPPLDVSLSSVNSTVGHSVSSQSVPSTSSRNLEAKGPNRRTSLPRGTTVL